MTWQTAVAILVSLFWIYSGWRVVLGRSGHLETKAGPLATLTLFIVPLCMVLAYPDATQGLLAAVPWIVVLWVFYWLVRIRARIQVEKRIKALTPEYDQLVADGKHPTFVLDDWSVRLEPNTSPSMFGGGYTDVSRIWSESGQLHVLSMVYRHGE